MLNLQSARFKGGFDKWRLAFLIFAIVYACFLLVNIAYMSIQWDEVTHLNGGTFLLRGDFQGYFNNNAFYPPLYDLFTAGSFAVVGISVFANRLVTVIFSVLTLFVVFEFGYRTYGPKVGLLAAVFLGIMPGYFWLSRMAMIETMLIFFFTVSALFFFSWLRTNKTLFLFLSGLSVGLGILTKYQLVIVGAIMLMSLVLFGRGYLKKKLSRFPLLILTVVAVVTPWIVVSYQLYASGMFNTWLYAMNIGNPDKLLYSLGLSSGGLGRFPTWFYVVPSSLQTPIFYFVELTLPYVDVHPISFFLYALGLLGMAFFAFRRKTIDKYFLLWFVVVYVFFTAIPNKQWRYLVPIFPVLAFSAASLLMSAFKGAQDLLKNQHLNLNQKRYVQGSAIFLIALTAISVAYSVSDTQSWVVRDQVRIPLQEATEFAGTHLAADQSVVVVCPLNLFSKDMVRFYMSAMGKNNSVLQYPEAPVDTYTPVFDITEFINVCKQNNVKYVFTYEYGGDEPYFNTTLSLRGVYEKFYESGQFTKLMDTNNGTYWFGSYPRRIFVLTFLG
jgi:4-amino-4-deoxy-L-arabinose transferase-like glycosyltransferase